MTLYVYNPETRKVIAKFDGDDNSKCEAAARQAGYDPLDQPERYAWTYTPAFGANDGLRK